MTFFDACFSGALLTPKGLVRESPLVVSVVPLGGRGRYLVTSSGANQLSYESGLIQGSPFAEALRSGLRGAADANGNGEVTLPELYDYIYRRTYSATVAAPSGPQHPVQSVQLDSAGEVVLVELRHSATASVRGAASLGRCYVLDQDGSRVLAALERPTEQVFVPPAEYIIKCIKADEVLVARAQLGATSTALDSLPTRRSPPPRSSPRGGRRVGVALLGCRGGRQHRKRRRAAARIPRRLAGSALVRGSRDDLDGRGRRGHGRSHDGPVVEARRERPTEVALGGGSFVEVDSPRVLPGVRGFVRLDVLATHPVEGGALGATLAGSVGVELGR